MSPIGTITTVLPKEDGQIELFSTFSAQTFNLSRPKTTYVSFYSSVTRANVFQRRRIVEGAVTLNGRHATPETVVKINDVVS